MGTLKSEINNQRKSSQMLVFEERGNRRTRRKPLGAEWRTNKLKPHMTPSLHPQSRLRRTLGSHMKTKIAANSSPGSLGVPTWNTSEMKGMSNCRPWGLTLIGALFTTASFQERFSFLIPCCLTYFVKLAKKRRSENV